jgi:hypothetical protein
MFELIHVISLHRTMKYLTKSRYNCLNIIGLSDFFNSVHKKKILVTMIVNFRINGAKK